MKHAILLSWELVVVLAISAREALAEWVAGVLLWLDGHFEGVVGVVAAVMFFGALMLVGTMEFSMLDK